MTSSAQGLGDPRQGHAGRLRITHQRDADVILALGIRFGENMTDGYTLLRVPDPVQKIVHVHASDREIGKVYRPALGIHASPERFALSLSEAVSGGWAGWREAARAAYFGFIDKAPAQPGPGGDGDIDAELAALLEDL